MHDIRVITFKGCRSTIDFRNRLEEYSLKNNSEINISIVVVPSVGKALQMGLFGAPTVLIDGVEYQQERRGPPGFY